MSCRGHWDGRLVQPKRHVQPSGLHWHGSLPYRGELYSMLPGWSLTVERLDAWGWRIPKPATGVNVTTGVHYRHRYVVELRFDTSTQSTFMKEPTCSGLRSSCDRDPGPTLHAISGQGADQTGSVGSSPTQQRRRDGTLPTHTTHTRSVPFSFSS